MICNGAALAISGPRQRALLTFLLLHVDTVVRREAAVDALWPHSAPPDAMHALEAAVSRLRQALGTDGHALIQTAPGGYVLRLGESGLDVRRFDALAREGREAFAAGDAAAASARFFEALALWHGPPFEELAAGTAGLAEAGRLEEARLGVLEDRLDADLRFGRDRQLIPELRRLLQEHPLRERLHEFLMVALYRSGRQAEALAVYSDVRAVLASELGLEPGPRLKELQRAILTHDSTLLLARSEGAAPAPRHHHGRPVALAAAALVAAILGLTLTLTLRGGHQRSEPLLRNGVIVIDQEHGRRTADISLDGQFSAASAGQGSVWLVDASANQLVRIDLETRAARDTIDVGAGPSDVAVGAGAVWVVNHLDGTLSRIDPEAGRVVETIRVGNGPSAVAIAGDSVWIANAVDGTLSLVSAETGTVRRTVPLGSTPTGLAYGAGRLWVTSAPENRVLRIDPSSGVVDRVIAVGTAPTEIAATDTGVWVINSLDGTVSRIDPTRGVVEATLPVGGELGDLTVAAGEVWVTNGTGNAVTEIAARTSRTVRVGGQPQAIAGAGGDLFVAVTAGSAKHRGGTLRVVTAEPRVESIDPAILYSLTPTQLLGLTNDGLVSFRHVGGAAGLQLVPDLAVSIPAPAVGGTTYTFELRPGLRYSSGRVVRVGDFRYAIERDFALRSPGAPYYRGIVGARACENSPASCDLSSGIVTDDRARTITFRLAEPDPDFLEKLTLSFAFAVPAGTPMHETHTPLPATGPYMIGLYRPRRTLELVRNPRFRAWSPAAQPTGFPDRIVWKFDVPDRRGLSSVERGSADWLFTHLALPEGRRRELMTRYAAQLHTQTEPAALYYFLNTRVPPFDDVRVRRAVNLAVDRRTVVRLFGGPRFAEASCQPLPPPLPGYQRYCPYQGSDLAASRRLIAASGTKGMRITVVSDLRTKDFLYVVSLLRSLDYRVTERLISDGSFGETVGDSRNRIQIGQGGWMADFPTPSAFLAAKFSCRAFRPGSTENVNESGFCDPTIDRLIARAQALELVRPAEAFRLWSRIDHMVADEAPWLFLVTPRAVDFVSKRVGNYQFHPLWGLLLDQLWVR